MTAKFEISGLGKAGHALGVASGVAMTFETDAFVGDLVGAATDFAAEAVKVEIDKMALDGATGGKLSHVYEWNRAGSPVDRLFITFARGNGKNRAVSFAFRASTKPVPTLRQRIAAGEVLPVPEKILSRMQSSGNQEYVFRQKAQIMEYGGNVTIRPRKGQKVFVPFRTARNGRTFAFVDSTRVSFAGKKNRGMFHAAWKLAQVTAGQQAAQMVEREVNQSTRTVQARMGKTATKSLSVGFTQGQDYSRNRMKLTGKMANAQVKKTGRLI